MDRGQELDWLRDRPAVQTALARVLHRPVADIRVALGDPGFSSDGRLVRLRDVKYARELDLTREELPPGIPPAALQPLEWAPLFWVAPSGAGRSLTGAWLKARGLAQWHVVRAAEDLKRLPLRGSLFLEIPSSFLPSAAELTALRVGERPLCIASPTAPRPRDDPRFNDFPFERFRVVRSPALHEVLPELVDWIDSRLGEDGHFDPDAAEAWMRRVALPLGAASTLGDALGLLGLLDETTPRSRVGKSLDELTEAFLTRRLRETLGDTSYGASALTHAFERLLEAGARCLASSEALGAARPLELWAWLLRGPEDARAPDPAWFRAILARRGDKELTRQELRELAERLPPAGYQMARALERARLLRSFDDEPSSSSERREVSFRLAPHFLVSVLDARALLEVFRLSPLEWGDALIQGEQGDRITRALFDSLARRQWRPVHRLLELADDESPAAIAAVEAATIAVGLHALTLERGIDTTTRELVDEACRFVVAFPDRLEPRFVPPRGDGFYQRDAWLTAWLALAERGAPLPPLLHPEHAPESELRRSVCAGAARFARGAPPELAEKVWALLDRTRALFDCDHPSPFTRLLDRLERGEAQLEELDAALAVGSFEVLVELARLRGLAAPRVFSELWNLTEARPLPLGAGESEATREFWRAASPALLERRRAAGLPIAWSVLLPHQLANWIRQAALPLPGKAARSCPVELLLPTWSERGPAVFDDEALASLFERAREKITRALPELLARLDERELGRVFSCVGDPIAELWLDALPPLERLLLLTPPRLDRVRAFLLDVVRRRADRSGRAFELLDALERKLLPLRLRRSLTPPAPP